MNRIILLVAGLAGGVWVLHDVGTVPSTAAGPRRAAIAPVATATEPVSDDTSRECQSPDDAASVATLDQPSPNPGTDIPGSTSSPTAAAGASAPQLEFPAPRIESNREADCGDTDADDETCGTAHPASTSKAKSPSAESGCDEPALTQFGSPEIGTSTGTRPDRAALARWLAASIESLPIEFVAGLRSVTTVAAAEVEQLPEVSRDTTHFVSQQALAINAAQHVPPPGYREIGFNWNRAKATGYVWPYKFVKLASPNGPETQPQQSPGKAAQETPASPDDGKVSSFVPRKAHYTQIKPTYRSAAERQATSASEAVQPPAKKPATEVSFVPEKKTSAEPPTAATTPDLTNDPTSHRKQSPAPQPVQKPSLSPEQEALAARVHRALGLYRNDRLLNSGVNSTWEVMHRIVAFGIPTEIHRDSPDGTQVNAIGWLLWGGRCTGQPLVVLSGGRPLVTVGVGVQGHPGQFLGMLAQSRVSPDSPFQLQGKHFTVRDLIEEEKRNCDTQMELTFKLISLSYYLKSDDEWTANDGGRWSIERLVHEELRQPIQGAACGGTHRLFGLSSSYKMRISRGEPVDGEYLRAQKYVRDYQRYTLYRLRNSDGSFSTDWFKRPADSGDPARKLQTTGHILEWLVFSLEDEQLRDPRVEQTVDFIATLLIRNPNKQWSIGPLGHALHALKMYDDRVFNAPDPASEEEVAERPAARTEPANAIPTATRPNGNRTNSRPSADQPPQPRPHLPARLPYEAPVEESAMASAAR